MKNLQHSTLQDRATLGLSRLLARGARRQEQGMTTAEYAVGTLGACTVGGVLVKVGQSEWFGELVRDVIDNIPNLLPNLF
ncbi:DUF4244 domain-containing protein [Aeromicrobium sp. 50.2.37]|uniref:DUF4244 domain-containing protein n=1 Tax=Aeromicrobium sp. 50.2.37 TaxID=2969305 RepID=UPI00215068E4|nr:DUF4244 domain-containing protein [Aeromicrobium sp. 50.2.37]MCR4513657.1 DUF4244 domain-containing protein [Aeromicrobium sp. 50.2.37]